MTWNHAGQYGPYTVTDSNNRLLIGGTVSVLLHGTQSLATLYTDRTKGVVGPNPLTVDTFGNLKFFADPDAGPFDLSVTYQGVLYPNFTSGLVLQPDSGDTVRTITVGDPTNQGVNVVTIQDSSNGRTGGGQIVQVNDKNGIPIFSVAPVGGANVFGDKVGAGQSVFGPFMSLDGSAASGSNNPQPSLRYTANGQRLFMSDSDPNVLATPVIFSTSTASSGGTLTAATYAYRVSALNARGETLASTEVTQVVSSGTTNTVTINWTGGPNASSYKVYGRTAGAELFIASVSAALFGTGLVTYTDTGSITPAGALPGANTTGFAGNVGDVYVRRDAPFGSDPISRVTVAGTSAGWGQPLAGENNFWSVSAVGGKSANGLYDDQSIQRTINAAAGGGVATPITSGSAPTGNYGGAILLDVPIYLHRASVPIKFPSKGNWWVQGPGITPAVEMINNTGVSSDNPGSFGLPGSIVGINGSVSNGGAPGGMPTQIAGTTSTSWPIFDATTAAGNQLLSVGFERVFVYQPFVTQVWYLVAINGSLGSAVCRGIGTASVNVVVVVAGGGVQAREVTISDCPLIGGQIICATSANNPGVINITNCYINGEAPTLAAAQTAGVIGTVVHIENFGTLNYHHNFMTASPNALSATQFYAAICMRNIVQTEGSIIDHNEFYGCDDMVLYYKNDHLVQSPVATMGLSFDNNTINGWNFAGFTNAPAGVQPGSAVVVDVSNANPNFPEQIIEIGANTWTGGNQAGLGACNRGLEIVGSPYTQNVSINRRQKFKQIQVAPVRVNGTDYGPLQRTDTATVSNGSATVTDASILASDVGKVVTGTGIPANTYVGTVTVGTSFLLSSSATGQSNVNATANGSSVTIAAVAAIQTVLGERRGVATLVAGVATVAATWVAASTKLQLTRSTTGGTVGHLSYTITPGVSFTINSVNTDTSTINWYADEIGVPF